MQMLWHWSRYALQVLGLYTQVMVLRPSFTKQCLSLAKSQHLSQLSTFTYFCSPDIF